jgi:hypothetical protein
VAADDARDDLLVCLVALAVAARSTSELHPARHQRGGIMRAGKHWAKSEDLAKAVQQLIMGMTTAIVATTVAATSR